MKRRILSIDGGGIRGILPASFLAALGPVPFDMVAGTSIGGIVATGLAHGLTAAAIETMLVTEGPSIFGSATLGLLDPKYDPAALEATLLAQFGDAMLADVAVHLLVPTCELNSCDVMFFKSWKAKNLPPYNFKLRDVARATSAAPTYFPMALIANVPGDAFRCVDGGMAVNNPTLCALLEARAMWPTDELTILSLGTGNRVVPITVVNQGISGWVSHISTAFMDFSVGPVDHYAETLTEVTVVRVDSDLAANVNSDFDDASAGNIAALQQEAAALVAANLSRAQAALA